jgi:hypothetical protein
VRAVMGSAAERQMDSLVETISGYVLGPLLALCVHPFIRVGGGKLPLRATMGGALFLVSAPATVISLAIWVGLAVQKVLTGHVWVLPMAAKSAQTAPAYASSMPVLAYGTFLALFALLPRPLAALHGVRIRWTLLGTFAAVVVVLLYSVLAATVAGY